MAYTNLFKKLAKAWGVEGDTNTEYGALAALAENPPFGTKFETVEILAEQSLEYVGEGVFVIPVNISYDTKCKYLVVYNGVQYICNCNKAEGLYYIGSGSIFGQEVDVDIPFIIITEETTALIVSDGSTSVTLSISTEQETVTPIPQKYLPEPVTFYLNFDELLSGDAVYLYKNTDFTEKAIKTDVPINKSFNMQVVMDGEVVGAYSPLTVTKSPEDNYIEIWILMGMVVGGQGTFATIYTAEYTG